MGQFFGWILGMMISVVLIAMGAAALAAGGVIGVVALIGAIIVYIALYVFFYFVAWSTIGVSGLTGANTATPNPISNNSEHTLRSIMIGMNVVPSSAAAFVVAAPTAGPMAGVIATWVFVVISLAAFFPLSQNRFFQGFLGWTGWITPLSLVVTGLGFLLFVVNLPFTIISAIASGAGVSPVRLDFTSGVVESAGWGPASWFNGGTAYSVGHFTFIGPATTTFGASPAPLQGAFLPPLTMNGTVSGHEVGHSLDWVAFGPLRWILAIVDQILMGNATTAYTELTADSRTPRNGRFQVDVWS